MIRSSGSSFPDGSDSRPWRRCSRGRRRSSSHAQVGAMKAMALSGVSLRWWSFWWGKEKQEEGEGGGARGRRKKGEALGLERGFSLVL